jgi:cell division septum initiation protein DivIVA
LACSNVLNTNNPSSELDQLRQENEFLKIQIEQLKRQIEQGKESTKTPDDRIDTLEEIIDERDDDIYTLKKQVDGASRLLSHRKVMSMASLTLAA